MSELKAHRIIGLDERCNRADNDYYLKSEADKVIAEKDAKILALDAEVVKQKHHAKLFLDERNYAETQLRHSNRKRCLAMAKYCELREDEFGGDFAKRWLKKWLELAEEPTWAKFLQLIHKEAT